MDVLDQFDVIKVCVAYHYKGQKLENFPSRLDILAQCEPVFEEMPGWLTDTSGITDFHALPENAKNYLNRLSQLVGAPITMVSVGWQRKETIICEKIF